MKQLKRILHEAKRRAESRLPPEHLRCPECDGTGVIDVRVYGVTRGQSSYQDGEAECTACNGDGWLDEERTDG